MTTPIGARATVIAIRRRGRWWLAVIVLLKGKVWTGLVGMFITPLLIIGAIRAVAARTRRGPGGGTAIGPRGCTRPLEPGTQSSGRPVVQAKLWLQHVIAGGAALFPDDYEVDQQLDREIHAAPAPPERTAAGA